MAVRGQLEGVGPLPPLYESGTELGSSGLATSALAALQSHQPILSFFIPIIQKRTPRPREVDRCSWGSDLVTELLELGTQVLGVVNLSQCGRGISSLRDPFFLENERVGPATLLDWRSALYFSCGH